MLPHPARTTPSRLEECHLSSSGNDHLCGYLLAFDFLRLVVSNALADTGTEE